MASFISIYVFSTDARGNCGKEQASSRVSWVPRAVRTCFISRTAANGRAHRTSLSVGLFSRRKLSLSALLQGWGKLHGNSGDYIVMVQIEPTPRGSRVYLE